MILLGADIVPFAYHRLKHLPVGLVVHSLAQRAVDAVVLARTNPNIRDIARPREEVAVFVEAVGV